jgi:hypothetical protein
LFELDVSGRERGRQYPNPPQPGIGDADECTTTEGEEGRPRRRRFFRSHMPVRHFNPAKGPFPLNARNRSEPHSFGLASKLELALCGGRPIATRACEHPPIQHGM